MKLGKGCWGREARNPATFLSQKLTSRRGKGGERLGFAKDGGEAAGGHCAVTYSSRGTLSCSASSACSGRPRPTDPARLQAPSGGWQKEINNTALTSKAKEKALTRVEAKAWLGPRGRKRVGGKWSRGLPPPKKRHPCCSPQCRGFTQETFGGQQVLLPRPKWTGDQLACIEGCSRVTFKVWKPSGSTGLFHNKEACGA